jgi:hypothetical protein
LVILLAAGTEGYGLSLFFAILGGLLVLAFVANRLVRFTRVPDVIILMATGVLIGPALHWVNPEIFRGATQGLGSLALILILFEGGLDLKIGEILRHFGPGFFLSIFSYVLSMMAVAEISHLVMHLSRLNALLTGAILGCIGGSILLPVLQQVHLRREVKVTLLIEASLGDAYAVLAVSTLLDVAAGGSAAPRAVAWTLASSLDSGLQPSLGGRHGNSGGHGVVLPASSAFGGAVFARSDVRRRAFGLLRRAFHEGQRFGFGFGLRSDAQQFSRGSQAPASG